jgi:hypothetical protein
MTASFHGKTSATAHLVHSQGSVLEDLLSARVDRDKAERGMDSLLVRLGLLKVTSPESGRTSAQLTLIPLQDVGEFINGYAFKPSDWSES